MTSLAQNASISRLAGILHAAMAVGSPMWDREHDHNEQSELPSPRNITALTDDLLELFSLLNQRQVAYLLVGGVALLRYIEGRNTDDIDLVLSVQDLDRMPEIEVQHRTRETARARFRSVRVDLLLTTNPVFESVLRHHATLHRFAELDVQCGTVQGLAHLKLYALPYLYAQGDLERAALYENDVAMLCLNHHADLETALGDLARSFSEGQMAELHGIVREIQARVDRMRATRPRP